MPDGVFSLHDNAIGQLADRMAIPQRYLRNLAGGEPWARQLAATVLNEHSGWTERSRVLVRTVGRRVKEIRKKCGLTQKQLAERMGFPPSMIATIERGRYNFKIETLSTVARALGCEIDFVEKEK